MSNILLVNPPIYDFAAYDLWTKPLGLLYIAALLKNNNHKIKVFDYLDRKHPALAPLKFNKWGCGQYYSRDVEKPKALKNIPRIYSRHGLPTEIFGSEALKMEKPDAILMTSVMTYWYPGVIEAVKAAKQVFPDTPVVLGGVYAQLCSQHAQKHSGADIVYSFPDLSRFSEITGIDIKIKSFEEFPAPYFENYHNPQYAVIRTSYGCPFRCSYCAIDKLSAKTFEKKSPEKVIKEIRCFADKGIKNIAFYDDALLYDAKNHIVPILESVINNGLNISIHTPNGLHTRFITKELACLMKRAGFIMPRLSFETADHHRQKESGGKVFNDEFTAACRYLKEAGYQDKEFGAYVLIGLKDQSFNEIEQSIRFVHSNGAKVFPAEYSPIPGTKDWEEIKDKMPSDDPLWHNNSIFPLYELASWQDFQKLKNLAKQLNTKNQA